MRLGFEDLFLEDGGGGQLAPEDSNQEDQDEIHPSATGSLNWHQKVYGPVFI